MRYNRYSYCYHFSYYVDEQRLLKKISDGNSIKHSPLWLSVIDCTPMLFILFHQKHLTIYVCVCGGVSYLENKEYALGSCFLGWKGIVLWVINFSILFTFTDTVSGTKPRNTIMNKFLSHYKIVWKRGKLPWQNASAVICISFGSHSHKGTTWSAGENSPVEGPVWAWLPP